jgi:addiction module HigA family antidote
MSSTRIRTHPGEVLREEFMQPLGQSANALARASWAPPNRITGIIAREKPHSVTSDTALRLARFIGITPRFWLNLQRHTTFPLPKLPWERSSSVKSGRSRPNRWPGHSINLRTASE